MNEKQKKFIKFIILIIIVGVVVGISINLVPIYRETIHKNKGQIKNQEIVTNVKMETITATDIENDASYIGKYVNYGGKETFKGVKWRIFNAENGQIQLIADHYINANVMPSSMNIINTGIWVIGESDNIVDVDNVLSILDRATLLNYINTTSNWSDLVAVTGATATGGPTIEQFIKSYNRTHGANSEENIKEIYIECSETMKDGLKGYHVETIENSKGYHIFGLSTTEIENLYIINNTNMYMYGYWLGSPSARDSSEVINITNDGSISSCNYSIQGQGLRPLVTLPSGITLVEQENGTYNIQKDQLKEKETIKSINIENDASYIGKYVNYGGQEKYKGVKWRIFNAENGQIQLIADTYIQSDVMPTVTDILKGPTFGASNYSVATDEYRTILLDYINTTSNWNDFVAVTGATVTGGPTIEQFKNSYNRIHGENFKIYIAQTKTMKDGLKGYHIGTSENPKTDCIDNIVSTNLYVIKNSNLYGYWLGSPAASYSSCIVSISYSGSVDYTICYDNNMGLRPLVTLPTGIALVEQEDGTYNIQEDSVK